MKSILVFLILSFISCNQAETTADLKHDFGRFHNGTATEFFHDSSFEEFKRYDLRNKNTRWLDLDHPDSKRLQIWLDRFHSYLKNNDPWIGNIPNPQILISDSEILTAHITTIPLCIEGKFNLINTNGTNNADSMIVDAIAVYKEHLNVFHDECLIINPSRSGYERILKGVFKHTLECVTINNLLKENGPDINISSTCYKSSYNFETIEYAKALKFNATSRFIVISKAFLSLKEEQVLAVLAHELGHYYLNHINEDDKYNYFYSIREQKNPGKPAVLTKADKLYQIGLNAVESAKNVINSYPVKNQKYHSMVFSWIHEGVWSFMDWDCVPDECVKLPCHMLQRHLHTKLGYLKTRGFPRWNKLRESLLADYKIYEENLLTCLDGKRVVIDNLKESFKYFPIKNIDKNMDFSLYDDLGQFLSSFNEKLPEMISDLKKTALEYSVAADTENIGYYTIEQEADEFAIELLYRAGITPYSLRDVMFFLLEQKSGLYPSEMNYHECLNQYYQGWPKYVPIADYSDLHHSYCFRAWNIDREIELHKSDFYPFPNDLLW